MVMGIQVIEGGAANGADLVMGEHHRNPVARANAEPQRRVPFLPIGEGLAVVGITLEPTVVMEGEEQYFAAILSVVGGRQSDLVPMIPTRLVLGELARIKLDDLREKLAALVDAEPQ